MEIINEKGLEFSVLNEIEKDLVEKFVEKVNEELTGEFRKNPYSSKIIETTFSLNKNIDILKALFNKNKLDDLSKLEFIIPKNTLTDGQTDNVENPRSRKKQG